jgi:hypothetical protein
MAALRSNQDGTNKWGHFDAVAAIPRGGIAKWRRKAASTS